MSTHPRHLTVELGNGRIVPAWLVLALVCVGQFMVVLDVSVVNLALPSVQHDLHMGTSGLQWIVNAYTLTFAGFLLLGGRAADLYGRRRVFLLGLTVFTLGSLLCGAAQSESWLIAARSLQGLGAAILAPATLTVLTSTFPEGRARAWALGVWSAIAAAGATAGSLVGGVLIEIASWRWIFFINVPIGIAALATARRDLPESKADLTHRHLDVLGAVTVTAGLVAAVFALVRTESYPWGSTQVLVPLGLALVLLAAFVFLQARISKAPMVPLRIFRSRAVAGANVVMFLLYAALFASGYFESLFMQRVLGYSPLVAGLTFLPQTVCIAAAAQITARQVGRFGPRALIAFGALVAIAGLSWLAQITPTSSFVTDMLGPFVLIGAGMGFAMAPVAIAGTAGVAPEEAGLASGLLNTARTMGASIGLAALSTISANRTAAVLGGAPTTGAHGAAALTDGYALAFSVSALMLVATTAVTLVAVPSRRALGLHSPLAEPALALEEA